jgi:hypothetical protein
VSDLRSAGTTTAGLRFDSLPSRAIATCGKHQGPGCTAVDARAHSSHLAHRHDLVVQRDKEHRHNLRLSLLAAQG